MTFNKPLAWSLCKRMFSDDKTKWNVAWENLLSFGWMYCTSLTSGRVENLYTLSGLFLDVSTVQYFYERTALFDIVLYFSIAFSYQLLFMLSFFLSLTIPIIILRLIEYSFPSLSPILFYSTVCSIFIHQSCPSLVFSSVSIYSSACYRPLHRSLPLLFYSYPPFISFYLLSFIPPSHLPFIPPYLILFLAPFLLSFLPFSFLSFISPFNLTFTLTFLSSYVLCFFTSLYSSGPSFD